MSPEWSRAPSREELSARLAIAERANVMLLAGLLCLLAGVALIATPLAAERAGLLAGSFVAGLGLGLIGYWSLAWRLPV